MTRTTRTTDRARGNPARPPSLLAAAACALLVACALLAPLAAAPTPARAAKGLEVALQDDAVLVSRSYFDRTKAYGLMRPLHVSRLRFNAVWSALNGEQGDRRSPPSSPAYGFTRLDDAIAVALAQGIKVELTITGPAPRWATARRKRRGDPVKPAPRRFGRFVRTVVKRYAGRVDVYGVWNEPNHKSWLQPVSRQAELYRALYAQAFRQIRKLDPKARVLIGETAPFASKKGIATPPLRFLRQLACVDKGYRPVRRCKPLQADGFAHHPYDFRRPPTKRHPGADNVTIANLDALTTALDRLARAGRLADRKGRGLDLWLTEYGYYARRETGRERVFPERTRAAYLRQAFTIALRNLRVRSMLQYLLVEYPMGMFRFNTAIVGVDGTPMKPFRSLVAWSRKAARRGDIATPGPAYPAATASGERRRSR